MRSAISAGVLSARRTDDAIDAYRRAIAINPNHAEAHNNLGLALRTRHEYDAAVESFRQAMRLQPNYPAAQSNLVVALQDAGRITEDKTHAKANRAETGER
jgi:Tfp pilus assembly protein PilF